MRRKNVSTGSPWETKVGYSRAVRVGTTVHVSATAGLDESAGKVAKGDAYAQAKRSFAWIKEALFKAGADMKDVVLTRIYLKNSSDWESIAKAHAEVFEDIRPATTILVVQGFINPDILVEIEAKAKIGITEKVDEDAKPVKVIHAISPENVAMVKDLLAMYASLKGYEFGGENFEEEMQNLPGDYAAPAGRLLLATYEGEAAGCVALKKLADNKCEVKRLYVPPEYRGNGIGKDLLRHAIEEARRIGYKTIVADTDLNMRIAMVIFDEHGFKQSAQGHFELAL
jgi:enamine deaminase RidA (YjgF/YER057c/UK114 family)/N-acetylglutamate synthase-like GNAT family acetyltransferase